MADTWKTATIETKFAKLGARFQKNASNRIKEARLGDAVVSFIDYDGEASCLRVRDVTDHDDIYSDYSAGRFCDSIIEAVRTVNHINTGYYS